MSSEIAEHGYGEDLRRRMRRRFVLLAIAVSVALASAVGLWWAQKAMTAGVPAGEAPLLRADGRPVKMRPQEPGGVTVPNQDRLILDPNAGKGRVEQLLPPPEEPLPPSALPQPEPPQPVAAPEPPPAAAPPPPVTAAPLTPPPANAPQPTQTAAPAAPPPPAPAAHQPVPAAPKPGQVRLQLGAVRSEALAKSEWDRLRRQHADLLGSFGLAVSRVEDPSRGTFYRLQAGPVESASADRICGELKRRNVGCLIVR
jgi:cell division septation protein DedD